MNRFNSGFMKGDVFMKQTSYLTKIMFISIMSCFVFYQDANAYLDPGTGSYVLQMLIAGLLGALFFIKLSWKRMKIFISNLFSKNKDDKVFRE